MSFASLGLSEALVNAVSAAGYTQPTPVQLQAIPAVLKGRDLMVAAQTGTGKTGGFALPILEHIFPGGRVIERRHRKRQPHTLVLAPTRELAAQVHDSFVLYAQNLPLVSACIFGGVGMTAQIKAIAKGVDVLVACPGRLLDLASQDKVDLSAVEILVLDEADRMLDMGFIHDVKKVLKLLPEQRQNLLFSATFSNDIIRLANNLLHEPQRIEVTPPNTTVERIDQFVYRLPATQKRQLLAHLVTQGNWEQVLVFTRTKHGANRLAEYLNKAGLPAAAIHGNKSQNARTKALADFKSGELRILVATDIAARGLDIDQLPYVVNFELPNVEEDYVHRIGRTGRAGRNGHAISLVSGSEERLLHSIERLTKQTITAGDTMNFVPSEEPKDSEPKTEKRPHMVRTPRNHLRKNAFLRKQREQEQQAQTGSSETAAAPASPNHYATEQAERPARKTRQLRQPRRQQNPTQSSDEQQPFQQRRSSNNTRPQHNQRRTPNPHQQRAAAPAGRDPEVFLDDAVDNFGNSVDYVSPYQKRQRGRQQGNSQFTSNNAARAPRGQAPRLTSHLLAEAEKEKKNNPRQNTTQTGHKPRQNSRPQNNNRGQQSQGQGRSTRYNNHSTQQRNSYNEPAPVREQSAPKPLIIRKGERLPSLEQLEQLEQRPRREKAALLTRSDD
ncbi:DEAD/DEAH box helicase [Pseudomonas sp. F1_0610]|uniref:DEAD/DEAH box helicase n=1 Tax=Pseudomonas sp. F1_0610 TaxID=3114284 RepID=UPI0039C01D2B